MNARKESALILFGAFASGKYPGFIDYLRRNRHVVLALDLRTPVSDAQQIIRRRDPEHVLGAIADYRYIDQGDRSAALAAVDDWSKRFDIRGVYTIREDLVELNQVVADYLDLPSPGWRASTVCRDKALQRHYLAAWSPEFRVCSPKEPERLEALQYPFVLKPTRRSGSSGVVVVRDQASLQRALPGYRDDETLLQERYIIGPEFSIESLVQDGRLVFAGISEKRTNHAAGDHFVEMAHTVPAQSLTEDMKARLLQANGEILQRLDFRNGISHAEFKIDSRGGFYLMEIAARNPGDGLLQLYQMATGTPMEDALMRIVMGEPASYREPFRVARQVYLEAHAGALQCFEYSGEGPRPYFFRDNFCKPSLPATRPEDPPCVREIMIEKSHGERLREIAESSDRPGCYFIDAPTGGQLDELEARVSRQLSVIVDAVEDTPA